tara:strand:+ start:1801 stop:2913 length:1113 start_codon:yes stop_codon:yes gene_type:complete
MNIIWFSEIRWDYLYTRKQHLLSLFPKKDNILFIQPFNFLKKESTRSIPENIICKTFPIFRRGNPLSIRCSNNYIFRILIYYFLRIYIRLLVKKYLKGHIDIICISNIFFIPIANKLKYKIVWDYNDDPEQFGEIPKWVSKEYNTLLSGKKTKIISCSKGLNNYLYSKFSNEPITIPNGVEIHRFQKYHKYGRINKKKQVIGYVGIVSSWFFDFELIKKISEHYPLYEIRLYGPQDNNALNEINEISLLKNVYIYPAQEYKNIPSIMSEFTIGIIPLKSIEEVWRAASAKLLQYLSIGLPVVSVYMEQYEKLSNVIMCKEHTEFIKGIDYIIQHENIDDNFKELERYDWKFLAKQFRIELKDTIANTKKK